MNITRIENGFILKESFDYSFCPPKIHYFKDINSLVDFVKKYYGKGE